MLRRSTVIADAGIVPANHKLESALITTTSNGTNEILELNADELDIVTGGGLFSFALSVVGLGAAASVYEKAGGPDVNVGVRPTR